MKILCDIDGTLAPFTEHLISYLNSRGHHRYVLADFDQYDLSKCIDKDHKRWLEAAPCDKNFAFSVPRYEGAQQFVKDLVAKGHEVKLVTALWSGPHWRQARTEWIKSFLSSPALRSVTYEFATPEERLRIPADILIDDRRETLLRWAKDGTDIEGFLINQPWNQGDLPTAIKRVYNYGEIIGSL